MPTHLWATVLLRRPPTRTTAAALEDASRRAFLAAARDHQDFALYRTAAQTGMRRGELLGLRWRDLDFKKGLLAVRQQWSRQDTRLRFGPPKTKKGMRSIDLDPGTISVLIEHRQAQELQRRAWGALYQCGLDLVLRGSEGSPQDPDVVYRRFARLMGRLGVRIGLPEIRFHDYADPGVMPTSSLKGA